MNARKRWAAANRTIRGRFAVRCAIGAAVLAPVAVLGDDPWHHSTVYFAAHAVALATMLTGYEHLPPTRSWRAPVAMFTAAVAAVAVGEAIGAALGLIAADAPALPVEVVQVLTGAAFAFAVLLHPDVHRWVDQPTRTGRPT